MHSVDLPPELRAWVEALVDCRVVAASRHLAGASRDAWTVDLESRGAGAGRALFLLRDKRAGADGSQRDAAVLHALADTPVPVPAVIGRDEALGAVLLERVSGRSDFPSVDREEEREPTARHLMELTAALHSLDPRRLRIAHLAPPESAEACARALLAPIERVVGSLDGAGDPFFRFALSWLRGSIPHELPRVSLVHSDMGPGNFLFEGGRVTAIVDWEVAHFGDPMEDLAAIAVRDMATPMGDLAMRLGEYEAAGGVPADLGRLGYYRVLLLTRNAILIGLGLESPPPGYDVVEMTMYQTLLMRAASLVLCDRMGIDRPRPLESGDFEAPETRRGGWIAALRRDLDATIAPALGTGLAAQRAGGISRALAAIDHEDRVGPLLDRAELEDLGGLLGHRPVTPEAADRALGQRIEVASSPDRDTALAGYFARRMLRLAERRRPLLGALYDRLPQPLEAP